MALINCSECKKEVSDRAAACPNCGAPIGVDRESVGSGVQHLTTTQGTSKALKLQTLLAVVTLIMGGVALWLGQDLGWDPAIGAMLLAGGAIWYIAVRLRIWWHHG